MLISDAGQVFIFGIRGTRLTVLVYHRTSEEDKTLLVSTSREVAVNSDPAFSGSEKWKTVDVDLLYVCQ